ncbi:MAG: bifunctional demethylmenaquinone methyltransferase/2-methoxy-6-polyprenyl-1,4-benzoquinol methylase UbiE [Rickettsiales bacterium]
MSNNTHFGYKTVDENDKSTLVRGVFDSVAARYDLMNDLMSAGLHRVWKNEMVNWLSPKDGMQILDVAGGTGDIAFRIKEKADCHVTICDINQQMLNEGKNRACDRNLRDGLDWVCGDAEALPLPDASVNAYTIAFGIRNVTHIDQALAEAHRVLRIGGRFLCLEFSHLQHLLLQKLYDRYSFAAIPKIGKLVTGDSESYQYLVESIRRFPKQEEFAKMMREAGFANVQYRNLSQGVVAIHSGRKI